MDGEGGYGFGEGVVGKDGSTKTGDRRRKTEDGRRQAGKTEVWSLKTEEKKDRCFTLCLFTLTFHLLPFTFHPIA